MTSNFESWYPGLSSYILTYFGYPKVLYSSSTILSVLCSLNLEVHTYTHQNFLKQGIRAKSIKRIEMLVWWEFYLLENATHKHHLIFFFPLQIRQKTFLIIYLCRLAGLKSACLQILQPSMLFLIRTNFTRSFLAKKLSTTIN